MRYRRPYAVCSSPIWILHDSPVKQKASCRKSAWGDLSLSPTPVQANLRATQHHDAQANPTVAPMGRWLWTCDQNKSCVLFRLLKGWDQVTTKKIHIFLYPFSTLFWKIFLSFESRSWSYKQLYYVLITDNHRTSSGTLIRTMIRYIYHRILSM